MNSTMSRYLMAAIVVGVACSVSACADMTSSDNTRRDLSVEVDASSADAVVDATKDAGAEAMDATADAARSTADTSAAIAGEVAEKSTSIAGTVAEKSTSIADTVADKSTAVAGAVADQSKAIAGAAAAGATDAWIKTKVKLTLTREDAFEDSDIDVDVKDHVLTLSGTVKSEAARLHAAAIASRTEGVARVVNTLVVK